MHKMIAGTQLGRGNCSKTAFLPQTNLFDKIFYFICTTPECHKWGCKLKNYLLVSLAKWWHHCYCYGQFSTFTSNSCPPKKKIKILAAPNWRSLATCLNDCGLFCSNLCDLCLYLMCRIYCGWPAQDTALCLVLVVLFCVSLSSLPLMECTFPPFLFLHHRPFRCLRRTWWDGVKEVLWRGRAKGNWLTRFTWRDGR